LLRGVDHAHRLREGLRRGDPDRLHRHRERGGADPGDPDQLPDVLAADDPRRVPGGTGRVSLKAAFDAEGYVRIDGAVAPDRLAALRRRMDAAMAGREARAIVKLGDDAEAAPLIATAPLRAAFDALLGAGGWREPAVLEDLRVKLPSEPRPLWWHIDVFERGPLTTDGDLMSWRASSRCGGVGLLVLLLLSDIGPDDAATVMRAG